MTTSNILDFTFGEIEEKKKNRNKCQIMLTSAKGFPMCVLILPFQKNRNLGLFLCKISWIPLLHFQLYCRRCKNQNYNVKKYPALIK